MSKRPVPPFIYHIVVADARKDRSLTDGPYVTVSPPSVYPNKWQVRDGKDGNIIIERPSSGDVHPSPSLTYNGDPKNPKPGDGIGLQTTENPTEWQLIAASEHNSYLRVANSHLGIGIGPEEISPPLLDLKDDDSEQLQWALDLFITE